MELPLGLISAIESQNCVLFLGSGIGTNMHDNEGYPAPTGKALANDLLEFFSIEIPPNSDLAKVSSLVEIRKGRNELNSFLEKRFSNLTPDSYLVWLTSIKWKAIFTTNYDNGIERAFELNGQAKQNPISISYSSDVTNYDTQFNIPIFHLHGALFGNGNRRVVITEDDFFTYKEQRRMLFEILKERFATSTFLYIGYANNDQNWKSVLSELSAEFYPSKPLLSYRIAPETSEIDEEILRSKGIVTIEGTLNDFVDAAKIQVNLDENSGSSKITQLKSRIPEEFKNAFDENPVMVARIIKAWDFVNSASFSESPNTEQFLLGDNANWGVIGAKSYFDRDIEDLIYEDILDYLTGNSSSSKFLIVLGAAGYGVTTLLKILAVKMILAKAGYVFSLKPDAKVLPGDIEFICTLFPSQVIFIIDNASEFSEYLYESHQLLRNQKKNALFILGERLNEWRHSQRKLQTKEFLIEPLSDEEIRRLLSFLEKQNQLKKLSDLPYEIRFSLIKERNKKDLLVTLREVTEGKSFDAILEDEYRGIKDSKAQDCYLTVCGFYQDGSPIRDQNLATITDQSVDEMYELLANTAEGVILFDPIDDDESEFCARSRHRIISQVVWERCGNVGDKSRLLQKAISSLNMNYGIDKRSFEHLVRSDKIVDTIQTFEGKTKFFESACQKDPFSPYVRQHYARMLLRENKYIAALAQIDEAIKLGPRIIPLYHTKGLILLEISISGDDPEFSRKRLSSSEQSFQIGINIDSKDEYCYQGLTHLYIKWAEKAQDPNEKMEYYAKAQAIINEGLLKARTRDSLWIEYAYLHSSLINEKSKVEALENAVLSNTNNIVARYLLANTYRKQGDFSKALGILDPIINNFPDEYRCFLEYALCLFYLGKPLKAAIQILNISTLYGYNDARYLATLGGLLFLDNQFTEAKSIFLKSTNRNFSISELNQGVFRPRNDDLTPIKFSGIVTKNRGGYCWIEVPGYSTIMLPGSKYGGLVPNEGEKIEFDLIFTARGPMAENPLRA